MRIKVVWFGVWDFGSYLSWKIYYVCNQKYITKQVNLSLYPCGVQKRWSIDSLPWLEKKVVLQFTSLLFIKKKSVSRVPLRTATYGDGNNTPNCQVDYFNFLIPWFCCSCCYNLVLSLMEWVWNKWSVSIRFSGNLSCLKNMFNIYKALLTFGNIGSLIFQTWPFDGKLNNFQEIALIFIFNIFFRYFLVSLTQFI